MPTRKPMHRDLPVVLFYELIIYRLSLDPVVHEYPPDLFLLGRGHRAFFVENPVIHASPEVVTDLPFEHKCFFIIQVVKHTTDPQSVHKHAVRLEISAVLPIRHYVQRIDNRYGMALCRHPESHLVAQAFGGAGICPPTRTARKNNEKNCKERNRN